MSFRFNARSARSVQGTGVDAGAAAPRPAPLRVPGSAFRVQIERPLLLLIGLYLLTLPLVTHDIRASDEIEYYAYLRSLAFDRDLDFRNEYEHFFNRAPRKYTENGFKRTFLDTATPTGKRPNFGPIGTALLWAPFFAAGHLVAVGANALGAGVVPDGYSKPYLWAITFGSALLALAGLVLAYRLGRSLAGPGAAFWATLTIWLATPTIFYAHLAPGYSHAASLFAVGLFLTLWARWRDDLTTPRAAAVGAAGGLVAMVREQDALFLAVPVVYAGLGLVGWGAGRGPFAPLRGGAWGRGRMGLALAPELLRTARNLAVMAAAAILTFVPQLLTYRVLNGNWRPNKDVSDKMNLIPPHFWQVVLSPSHGLLFWSPVVLVAIVGLALLIRRNPRLGLALLAGFVLTWYINGAIKTWTTMGSFGARRFLNCTPIFVAGLACAYDALGRVATGRVRPRFRAFLPALVPLLSLVAIAWNAGLIVQFVLEYMDRQRMEWPLVLLNQGRVLVELPGIVGRLLTDRGSFYKP